MDHAVPGNWDGVAVFSGVSRPARTGGWYALSFSLGATLGVLAAATLVTVLLPALVPNHRDNTGQDAWVVGVLLAALGGLAGGVCTAARLHRD